jgi:hypothetical protein
MTDTLKPAGGQYLDRYNESDDGLRFMPGIELQLPGLPPLPDGILGDKVLRQHLRTDLFKGPIPEKTIVEPQHSIDELNDIIQYFPWNFWDQLVLRATEGVSGLIPRQEYELLSFANAWYRWPEFMIDMTEHVGGLPGVVELGRQGRQPASKINMLHIWCLGIVTLLGRAVYLILDQNKADDFMPELNSAMKFWEALAYGYRGDGYLLGSQTRYRQRHLDEDWVERFETSLVDVDQGSDFNSLMAAAELLAFYVHFDCRLGMMDLGPWVLPNGNPLIVRNAFLREEIYPWSMPCDGLPYAMTFAFEIDAQRAGLEEVRCIDIGTLMTRPYEYVSSIVRGSVWVRDEWDSEVRQVDLSEAVGQWYEHISEASLQIFEIMARTPKRHLIENGAFVYYVGMIYPFMRQLGLYDTYKDQYKLWEFDQRASAVYYELERNQFARVTVPTKLFDPKDTAFALVPEGAKRWRSKYAYV